MAPRGGAPGADIGRASSNEIARRAGVNWGVIQHHFGTREELLLAVLRRDFDQFTGRLATAEITGDSTIERLGALAEVVWSYNGRPEYLATMQVQRSPPPSRRTGSVRSCRPETTGHDTSSPTCERHRCSGL